MHFNRVSLVFDKGFYGHFFGSGIAFSTGALFFYFRDSFKFRILALLMIPIIMFVIPYVLDFKSAGIEGPGWVLHVLILVITLIAFELFLNKSDSRRYITISKFLGDVSYPVFLLHWPSSVLTLYLFSIKKTHLRTF